jgi:hypothetical protein
MVASLVIAVLLLGHGLIHLGFVGGKPSPTATTTEWPFELSRSWVLSPLGLPAARSRLLGSGLVAVTVAAFAAAALVVVGLLPGGLWTGAVVAGGAASLGLLGLFFQRWLVIGFAIDVVLLWAVAVAGWQPTIR